eukprot:jgi/Botrbrau1/417/Bobra.110_2s0067.1
MLMLDLCTWSFRFPLLRDDEGSNDRGVEGLDLHWPKIMSVGPQIPTSFHLENFVSIHSCAFFQYSGSGLIPVQTLLIAILQEILQQWSSRIDWNFMNFLACVFDSLDIRRDGTVQLRTFLVRLSGYDPVVDAPLEVQAAKEQRDEAFGLMREGRRFSRRARRLQNRLAQALGEEPKPVNLRNTQLVPGVTRLTGAGYIGQESSLAPRTPVLTLEEQEMFLRVNDEDALGSGLPFEFSAFQRIGPGTAASAVVKLTTCEIYLSAVRESITGVEGCH